MSSQLGLRSIDYSEELGKDLSLLLREQRRQEAAGESDRGLDILRSGSAPPTIEGSLTAVGGLFTHHSDVWSAASHSPSENKRQISVEELRSDPAYINYYYSNVNLNPRLPPPLLSKEDWRFAQRVTGGAPEGWGGGGQSGGTVIGGIGDRRISRGAGEAGGDVGGVNSFFPEMVDNGSELGGGQEEWSSNGLIGLPGLGMGGRQKSIAEMFQDDLNFTTTLPRHSTRPSSRNTFDENLAASESQFTQLDHDPSSTDMLSSTVDVQGVSASKNAGSSASLSYASALGSSSLSRSTTPDPQLIARAPSPRIPTAGEGRSSINIRSVNGLMSRSDNSSKPTDVEGTVAAFSGMNLSGDCLVDQEKLLRSKFQHGLADNQSSFSLQGDHGPIKQSSYISSGESGVMRQQSPSLSSKGAYTSMGNGRLTMDRNNYYLRADGQVDHQKLSGSSSPSNYHSIGSPSSAIPNYSLSGHNINPALGSMMASQLSSGNMPLLFENAAASTIGTNMNFGALGGTLSPGANLAAELQNHNRAGYHTGGGGLHGSTVDPLYLHYLRSKEYAGAQGTSLHEGAMDGGNSYMDLLALQNAYLGTLLSLQKSEGGGPYGKSGTFNPGYYGNQTLGLGMAYGGNPLINSLFPNSPAGSGSPMRHTDRNMRLGSGMRNMAASGMGGWRAEAGGIVDHCFGSSLLDEFKSNKTKCFELSEIAGHVVEFSSDQYGSRFIQQKLEIATADEKDMVFHEIMPQALSLMTDVFGNYVVQKFFEHGTAAQVRELANKLTGHVLTLSLQMYGCRVIQKAIEVVDLDQQKKMVTELDGHIMRCVRDQNGNHVIQKCIECIPEDAISFIVSTFFDQVVTLSTHPYGCRVIQRVLEHCHDPKTQQIVMEEIMQSICMLAQDQYGNYVVQHVLEHGKPDERSAIISKLIGKVVQMSQQKFASNVIEKCLTYGDLAERQSMVHEILGTTEENDPLQVMMKDQFGNYVVQKVLETCDDQQLEAILIRIKIHLNALKKYTYGKHIVARVEKLVVAGERRIGMLNSYPAAQ